MLSLKLSLQLHHSGLHGSGQRVARDGVVGIGLKRNGLQGGGVKGMGLHGSRLQCNGLHGGGGAWQWAVGCKVAEWRVMGNMAV